MTSLPEGAWITSEAGVKVPSGLLAFVSSWIVVPFAVFTWGTTVAFLLLWTGWLLGGAATYGIGRFLGRPAARWLGSAPVLARYEDRISRHTPFGVVLLAQFALPSEVPGYVLGMMGYPFARYLAALGIVELAYGIATIYLGVGVVENRAAPVVTAAAALALATAGTAYILGKRLTRERRAAVVSAAAEQTPSHQTPTVTASRPVPAAATERPSPRRRGAPRTILAGSARPSPDRPR